MNYIEIGVDIEKISKIKEKNKNPKFKERVLTRNEIKIYDSFGSEKRKLEFLSGRFSAKESIYKALSDLFKIGFHDVEIVYDKLNSKKPKVNILNSDLKKIMKEKKLKIILSISHNDEDVISYVNLIEN